VSLVFQKVNGTWFLDGRQDLRWWQHRHPDPRIQTLGKFVMAFGAFTVAIGLLEVLRVV